MTYKTRLPLVKEGMVWKSLLITGTPGTGKTRLAAWISQQLGIPAFSIKEEAEKHGLVEGFDEERNALIIPEEAVEEVLSRLEAEHERLILEGHLAHFALPKPWRRLIVLETPLGVLRERLAQRGYSEEKIRENLDAEIFKVCRIEAEEEGWEPLVLSTDEPVETVGRRVVEWLGES